jgi:hypothetical protein
MRKITFLLLLFFVTVNVFSQQANVTWGNEFKLHKGSTDLAVVYSDNSGVYLKETHAVTKMFSLPSESATLVKLDNSLTEIYRNDFNKELKGKDFEQFFILQNKFFIIASSYNKKEKTLMLLGAEVDKSSGELSGDWQEITSWQKEEKGDNIDFKISCNADSTKMVVVSSVEGKDKNSYEVRQFDTKLKSTDKPIVISNEFDPKTFQLEDVLYTTNENVVLVGRIYEYEEGKKKKAKFLDFKNYNVRIYDNTGKMIKEVNTDIAGKWLVSTKVVQEKDKDLVLAAFYSNEKKGAEINGLLVQRIDPATGNVLSTNQKDINTSLITTLDDGDSDDDSDDKDSDSKKEKKEREKLSKIQDDAEGFSRYMQFRNIFYTPDNGLVILAEKYHSYTYTESYYEGGFNGMPGNWVTRTYTVYECGDLMMSKIDATGNISWLQVLPKDQKEVIENGYSNTGGFSVGSYYFANFNLPFYAGFGALAGNNTVNIIFNDNKKNENVLQLGQKVKSANYFRKTGCYQVTLDILTGKYKRTSLFDNTDQPTAMPRLGSVIGKNMFIVGKEDRIFGKTKIAVAEISVK